MFFPLIHIHSSFFNSLNSSWDCDAVIPTLACKPENCDFLACFSHRGSEITEKFLGNTSY